MESERKRLGIPEKLKFRSKPEIGWDLIQRAKANGLSFEITCFDDLYGRREWLRGQLRKENLLYMADIPRTTHVYVTEPKLGVPAKALGKKGKQPKRVKVLSSVKPQTVFSLARNNDTQWYELSIRPTERGELRDLFTVRPVWTVYEDKPVKELLVII
jgi:SRSO17 transposase